MSDRSPLLYARLISTLGLGLSLGLQSSINFITVPALFAAPSLTPADRLHLWRETFDKRGRLMVPLELGLFLALAICALIIPRGQNEGSMGSRGLLALAAGATFASVPYTVAVMVRNVKRLKAVQAGLLIDPSTEQAGEQTDAAIKRWAAHNRVRIVFALVASVAGLTDLALH